MKIITVLLLILALVETQHTIMAQKAWHTITSNQRMLTNSVELHGFRITVDFDAYPNIMVDFPTLIPKFNIAISYFHKLLRVKQQYFDYVKYPDNLNDGKEKCLNYFQIPTKYITNGFDPNVTDMIVLPFIQNTGSYYSSFCNLRYWITYSVLQLNIKQFSQNTIEKFHEDAIDIIIMMNRILGFDSYLFSYFYKDINRSQFRQFDQVVKQNLQNKSMVVTPNVLDYVQNYFNCHDMVTGALIDIDIYRNTSYVFWSVNVFNDMMIPYCEQRGRRMTQVTLNLLKDTNYYQQVDLTMAYKSFFGKGKGCDFANGLIAPTPQFCNSQTIQPSCDMFYEYYGNCLPTQSDQNKSMIASIYSDELCRYAYISSYPYEEYDALSRCINVQNVPFCFITTCSPDKKIVYIKIGQKSYMCDGNQQTIFVTQLSRNITCPIIQIICENQSCQKWCDRKGYCINGVCLKSCLIENCLYCGDIQGNICQQCKLGYYLNLTEAYNQCSICDTNCLNCQNQSTYCTKCDVYSFFPILVNNTCLDCGEGKFFHILTEKCILCDHNCASCFLQAYNCTSCTSDKKLINNGCYFSPKSYGGYYQSSDKKHLCELGCKYCRQENQTLICEQASQGYGIRNGTIFSCQSNCLQCTDTSCTKCFNGFYLQLKACVKCSENCMICNSIGCQICANGYFVNSQKKCENNFIKHCQTLSVQNNVCIKCQDGYFYVSKLNICQQCISDCSICSSTNITKCLGCSKGSFLNENTCSKCIANCIECSNLDQCITCQDGYQINQKLSCSLQCTFPCFSCTNNQANKCTNCFEGYTLIGQECKQKSSSNNTICPLGYLNNANQSSCVLCKVLNCATCSLENQIEKCKHCKFGYYLNSSGQCQICQQGCQLCLNENYCQSCKSGYIKEYRNQKYSGLCYACQSPCQTCIKYTFLCTSCQKRYNLIGVKCIKSVNIKMEIRLVGNYDSFIQSGINTYNFRKDLLSLFNLGIKDFKKITVTSIKEGSVSVKAIYDNSELPNESLCSQYNSLKKQISAGFVLAEFVIQSATFQNPNNCLDQSINSNSPNISESQTNSSNTLIIILAIAIPLTVIFLCCKYIIIQSLYAFLLAADISKLKEMKYKQKSQNQVSRTKLLQSS